MEQKVSTSPIPFRNHTALLLSTALPYLQPAYRAPVELAMKFLEFTETLHTINMFSPFSKDISKDNKESGLFGLINTFVLDIEGLLNSLSTVCTGDEKEIIGSADDTGSAEKWYANAYGVDRDFCPKYGQTQ